MTAIEDEQEMADLLPDDLQPAKPGAKPLVRTKKQNKAAEKRAEAQRLQANAVRLAQIVNLHIAGHSLADIGAAVGATAEEIDRLLQSDVQRYVRSQPALRIYVRNYISEKYTAMLDEVYPIATDSAHEKFLESQDRAIKILDKIGKLHGAEAPTQTEVKVEAAPETVDAMVQVLAAQQGQGYDMSIFDTVPGEVVHEAHEEAVRELAVSGNAVGDSDGNDAL